MILTTSLLLLFALFSPVELFKFYHKSSGVQTQAAQPATTLQQDQLEAERLQSQLYLSPPRYYPVPTELLQPQPQLQSQLQPLPQLEQQQQIQQVSLATKGGELKATKSAGELQSFQPQQQQIFAPQPFQPAPSIAYLVVRPLEPAPLPQSFYEQSAYRNNFYQQQQQQQQLKPVLKQTELPAGIKGGRQTDEQAEQAIQNIEQQHEITEEPQIQQHQQMLGQPATPALVVPVPPGKEGKLRALLDKLMSKLTLGSSYHVVSEEIVQPQQVQTNQLVQQQKPLLQQQQHQQPIQQQPIEQQQEQKLEQIDEQRLEQQLEQQRDNAYEEGTKQVKSQEQQQVQQLKEEQIQQSFAEHDLSRQRHQQQQQQQQQLAIKGQQEPLRQELEQVRLEPTKGKRVVPDRFVGQQQQQQLQLAQEPLRQEPTKSNAY